MKLRAYLTIDLEAETFGEAAKLEQQIGALAERLSKEGFANVQYEIKERRDRIKAEYAPSPTRHTLATA